MDDLVKKAVVAVAAIGTIVIVAGKARNKKDNNKKVKIENKPGMITDFYCEIRDAA